jgi:hypothetical protein
MSTGNDEGRSYPVRKLPKTTVWADSTPLEPGTGKPPRLYSRRRIRLGLTITLSGYLVFLLGARPSLFGMDRSPVVGFVQLATLLVGLALICLGGYMSMMALWKNEQLNIPADIGLRLVATGYVIAVFAGMADIFGVGSHPLPGLAYFGPLQAVGMEIGQAIIAVGFFMMIPYFKLTGGPNEDGKAPQANV